MIENESQYAVSMAFLERFEREADELEAGRPLAPGVAPEFRLVQIEAARSAARSLREELIDYERKRAAGHDSGDEDRS